MPSLHDHLNRRTKTALIAALPLLAVAAFAVVSYTPVFRAREVRIEGAVTLSRQRVLGLARIGSGTNVFHLDTGAVEASLTADPWIASASVERHLPGTVVIRLQERTPIAQSSVGSAPAALAGDGVILPGADTAGLPEIRASVGALADNVRNDAARALAALTPNLRARVGAVVAQPSGSLVMELAGHLVVRYGDPGDDVAKATALRSVLAWAADQSVALRDIDLTVPQAPSATLADGSTITP
jgi:cell division protein FtsQ